MYDKPIAAFVMAIAVAPICAVCIVGPAVIGSMLAGAFGWFAELSLALITGLAIITAVLIYGIAQRQRSKSNRSELGVQFPRVVYSDRAESGSLTVTVASVGRDPEIDLKQPNASAGGWR